MQLIKEQLSRINHFLLIMVPLFIVNALFNLNYDWGGVSVIARVYIMVLSFYIIFIFSQIDVNEYKNEYTQQFGWIGSYYLFVVLRIFPFLFIYLLTAIFTFINYLNNPNWPLEPVYRLLDGRYSNTVIYPLILFIIMRQKIRPRVSVPLFLIFSILYYATDHILYSVFEPGFGVAIIKISKYILFVFILIYGYSKSRWRIFESVSISVISGLLAYASVTSFMFLSFYASPADSQSLSISGRILLKSGYVYPLERLKKFAVEKGTTEEIKDIFLYIDKYGKETGYTDAEWEKIITKDRIEKSEYLFRHLNRKNIKLSFNVIQGYAADQFSIDLSNPPDLPQFTRYFGSYYIENKKAFFELYKSGNETMKITVIKSLAYSYDTDAVNFLIDTITSVDQLRAQAAYDSLKIITGKDPANSLKKEKHDLDVVFYFREYFSKLK